MLGLFSLEALTELWSGGSSFRPLNDLFSLLSPSKDRVQFPVQRASLCQPLGNACSTGFSDGVISQVIVSDVYDWLFTLALSRMIYLKKKKKTLGLQYLIVTYTHEISRIAGTQALSILLEKHRLREEVGPQSRKNRFWRFHCQSTISDVPSLFYHLGNRISVFCLFALFCFYRTNVAKAHDHISHSG